MNTISEKIEEEVKENYQFFKEKLPELMTEHKGKFLVLRNRKIEGYCNTHEEAVLKAKEEFPDGLYSIQQVSDKEVDLGFISSYAVF